MLKQVVRTTPTIVAMQTPVTTTLRTTMITVELELQLQLEMPPRARDQEGVALGIVSPTLNHVHNSLLANILSTLHFQSSVANSVMQLLSWTTDGSIARRMTFSLEVVVLGTRKKSGKVQSL